MRREVVQGFVIILAAASVFAQSPPGRATASIGGKSVSIQYSAPSVRGRKIFGEGGLLSRDPTYPVWRAGLNAPAILARGWWGGPREMKLVN